MRPIVKWPGLKLRAPVSLSSEERVVEIYKSLAGQTRGHVIVK